MKHVDVEDTRSVFYLRVWNQGCNTQKHTHTHTHTHTHNYYSHIYLLVCTVSMLCIVCVPASSLMKCVCVVVTGAAVQQEELNLVRELRQSS